MKRIKLLSIILTVTVCISLSVNLVTANSNIVSNTKIDAIESVLEGIAFEKDYYGFEGVNLSEIWIGDQMPTYEAINGKLIPLTSIEFYPLFNSNGELISMAAVQSIQGNVMAYISGELVKSLNDFAGNTSDLNISLVYDNNGVYLWDGETISLLQQNRRTITNRDSLSEIKIEELVNILTCSLVKTEQLHIGTTMPAGFDDEAAYVNVPVKRQPSGSAWNWAACMASIVEYENGDSYTTKEMANIYTNWESVGKYFTEIQNDLKKDFNISYTYRAEEVRGCDLSRVLNSLGRDHPVLGGFATAFMFGEGHVVVIRGIDLGADTYSFMDPAASGANYRTGTISNKSGNFGTLTFVGFTDGKSYQMYEYLYR